MHERQHYVASMSEPAKRAFLRPRAMVASLVATAKLNGVEPLAWLTNVLERMVSGRTKTCELEQLLPWNWQPAAGQLARAA